MHNDAAGARNYPKGERRRAQIIHAAFQAFGTVGYRNTSMLQLAADCGVSRAGLLHHFPTKESLLEAVLEQRERQDNDTFFSAAGTRDGLEYFASLVRLVAYNQANPGIVSLFAVLSAEASDPAHPAHAYFVARYERARVAIQRAVDDLAARKLLRAHVDPGDVAVDLIALMDGLQIQWLLAPGRVDMPTRLRARLRDVIAVELPAEDPTVHE
ncbi:MAG TPA: TetR/AcrR family transcriptional regulator [Pseudonocardiaceae bacterium]